MDHLHSQAFFRTLSPHLQNVNAFLTQPYYSSCLLEPFYGQELGDRRDVLLMAERELAMLLGATPATVRAVRASHYLLKLSTGPAGPAPPD